MDIKQYDPNMNSVIILLTLRMDKILGFTQLKDGRFVIINEDGGIMLYEKNKTGTKLERAGQFFVHAEDTKFIVDSSKDFESFIIDKEVMIFKSRRIFLQEKYTDVIPKIL